MSERDDATPLDILDRYQLVKTAIEMIDDGIEYLTEEALAGGAEMTDEMVSSMEDMRADSYVSMLWTMVNDADEAKIIVRLLQQESEKF